MMLKRKKKKKEKIEEVIEETVFQENNETNNEQIEEQGTETTEVTLEENTNENENEEKAEIVTTEDIKVIVVEESDESKVSGLETSIAISKDLLDEKGIDVVKVEQENKVVDDGKIEIKTTISTKNYDEAVVKLINEVKIFSDEDADLGIKNKRRVWPIILIILILLAIAGGVYYYLYIHEEEPAKKDADKKQEEIKKDVLYRYEETEDGIVFYGDNEIISTYECEKCVAYNLGTYKYFSSNPTVLAIQDGEEIFLYDYTLNSIVGEKYIKLQNLKQDEDTVAFIVTDNKGMSGIIDTRGNVIVPLEYEALGYSASAGEVSDYSYKKDIITAKKNGYWGAINFKGEEIVPFEYEDIYYNGYNAFSVYVEGLWYLHNINNNRLIATGYDIIIPINSYVFASVNNIFYVLNYKGESIISKEIPTYLNTFRSRENSIIPTFKIVEDGTVVNIYIMNTDEIYDIYKFNTVNGELTEIIQ